MKKYRDPVWWLGLAIGALAFIVMPDGPWYRRVGAFFLAVITGELCAACAINKTEL